MPDDTQRLTLSPARDFTAPMNAVLPRRRSQAWTLANCLTYGRLAAVPVLAGLLFVFIVTTLIDPMLARIRQLGAHEVGAGSRSNSVIWPTSST